MTDVQQFDHTKYPGKAGISWPTQEGTSDPVAKFFSPGSKLTWHWNWSKHWKGPILPNTSPDLDIKAEFMPMIWSPELLTDSFELQEGWKLLLGFNEPGESAIYLYNTLHHDNAAVAARRSPQEAASTWIAMSKLCTEPNQELVSPAVAFNSKWLTEFFSIIPPETMPEYLAVHIYTTTFESFKTMLEGFWDKFKLPIIVTEFAMQSWDANVPGPQSQQQVHDFMGQTTKWMDETPYIYKYSWFGSVRDSYHLHGVHEFNRLMDQSGEITPLGHQYINGGHD